MDKHKLKYAAIVSAFIITIVAISVLIHPSGKQMGILQMESYQYEESLERLHKAYDENPKDIVTLKYLSRLYNILGKPDKEIQYLEEYVAIKPDDLKIREELAKVYLWNLKPELAKIQFQAILDIEPDNVPVLRKLASSYLWEQRYQDSLDCYHRIDKLGKLNFEDYKTIIKIYMGFPNLVEAIKIYKKIKTQFPNQFKDNEYLGMASLYLWTKDKKRAFELLDELLAQSENVVAAKLSIIEWHIDKAIPLEVIPRVKDWIRQEPKSIVLREALIELYLEERMNEKAIAELRAMLLYIHNKDKYLTQLYWLLIEEEHEEAAYEVSKQISDPMKEREEMWASLGYLSLSLKKYDESYIYWKKVQEKDPDSFEAHDGLFEYYRLTGNKDKANIHLTWLLERRPDQPSYLQYQIQQFIDQKKYQQAYDVSKRAYELDPRNTFFLESNAASARELKKWNIASKQYLKLYKNEPEVFYRMTAVADLYLILNKTEDLIPILNDAQFIHRKNEKHMISIGQYFAACKQPYRQLEILQNLEKSQPGQQYEDQILTIALNEDITDLSLDILLRRLKENPNDKESFLKIFEIYEASSQYKKQAPMLQHPKAMVWLGRDKVFNKKITFAEDAGDFKQAISLLEQYFKIAKEKEKTRLHILKLSGWANLPKLEKKMILKYGKPSSKEGLKLANIYYEDKEYEQCLKTLSQLQVSLRNSVEAWELRYYCAPYLKNKTLHAKALDFMIKHEVNEMKQSSFLAERAGVYYGEGKLEQALEDAEKAIKINPELNNTKIILGYIYYDKKEYRKSVDYLKASKLTKIYDRFLLGAGLLRFQEGVREGMRQFKILMSEHRNEDSFKKWNLYLDIGYEIRSSQLIEKSWDNIMQRFYRKELLPRYALHLLYTDRKRQAESIFKKLKPSNKPSYIALQKVFAPKSYKGKLSNNERLALADALQRNGRWLEASLWLKEN